ncbi:hypothetical protein RRSWK_06715 [Rhodopirellula sp. SWK7]|nr:hypothetical protein RRSWK_06715 [Rhodopirellula sp. SWK7]
MLRDCVSCVTAGGSRSAVSYSRVSRICRDAGSRIAAGYLWVRVVQPNGSTGVCSEAILTNFGSNA